MLNIFNKIIKNNIVTHLIFINILLVLIYYVFNLTLYSLLGLYAGVIFGIIILNQLPKMKLIYKHIIILISASLFSYFFVENYSFITFFILGFNLIALYIYCYSNAIGVAQKIQQSDINLVNLILLATLIFGSAIEKFRGANKLVLQEINLTIPLVVLIVLGYYFLMKSINSKKNINSVFESYKLMVFSIIYFTGSFFLISSFIFSEIGAITMFGPLFSGLLAFSIDYLRKKYNLNFLMILSTFFLLSYPYIVAGLLGIIISFLCVGLLEYILNTPEDLNDSTLKLIFPVVFMFTATEFRENAGLITRFNLASGAFMSNILIGICLVLLALKVLPNLLKLLKDNDIAESYPFFTTLFTIFALSFTIRFGLNELLVGIISGTSIFILANYFYRSLFLSKKDLIKEKANIVNFNLLNFIGSVILTVLIRI